MIALTLYSRPGCHLCDEMKGVIARVVAEQAVDITLEEVDISTDAELESRYGTEIPVLLVNGRKVAKYRVTEGELARMLNDRAGWAGKAGKAGGENL
jgi:thiol-disulfide isomerase/thioredoxin